MSRKLGDWRTGEVEGPVTKGPFESRTMCVTFLFFKSCTEVFRSLRSLFPAPSQRAHLITLPSAPWVFWHQMKFSFFVLLKNVWPLFSYLHSNYIKFIDRVSAFYVMHYTTSSFILIDFIPAIVYDFKMESIISTRQEIKTVQMSVQQKVVYFLFLFYFLSLQTSWVP